MSTENSNIGKCIDILVIIDFVISMVGGIIKKNNEIIANYCFMVGGIFLFLAVCGIIYKYIKK